MKYKLITALAFTAIGALSYASSDVRFINQSIVRAPKPFYVVIKRKGW